MTGLARYRGYCQFVATQRAARCEELKNKVVAPEHNESNGKIPKKYNIGDTKRHTIRKPQAREDHDVQLQPLTERRKRIEAFPNYFNTRNRSSIFGTKI